MPDGTAPTFSNRSLPPQNIEAEESVLGGLLLDPYAMQRVLETELAEKDFYVQQHRFIFKGCLELHRAGMPVDLMTISTWLNDKKLFEKIGSSAKLASLVDRTVSAVNVDLYAKLIKSKSLRRMAIAEANELIDIAFDTSKPEESIKDKSAEITSFLVNNTTKVKRGFSSLSDAILPTFTRIEEAAANYNNPEHSLGVTTGFYEIDQQIIGFDKGNLTTFIADSGVGKSTFVQNVAVNVSMAQGTVLYFSTGELSQELVTTRFLSRFSQVPITKMRRGRLNESDNAKLIEAMETISEFPLHINSECLTASLIYEEVQNFKALNPDKDIALVVVDYIQNIDKSDCNGIGHENIVHIMEKLKRLAADFDTHVLAASQVKQSATGQRPMVSDVDGSKTIRDKSQLILGGYRTEEGAHDSDLLQIAILKNTSGEAAGWKKPVKLLACLEIAELRNMVQTPQQARQSEYAF